VKKTGFSPIGTQRLQDSAAGRLPWVATMRPAELIVSKSHGIRPIATVSGACSWRAGISWSAAHAAGWQRAIDRLRQEAAACGANAVIDTRLRTRRSAREGDMDFMLFGTAVRVDGLAPNPAPIIATIPALEFVRLLEAGIVPVGIAVGASQETFNDRTKRVERSRLAGNFALLGMSNLWARSLRKAHEKLRQAAMKDGNGVLASVHIGDLTRSEGESPRYVARHLVIATVIDAPACASLSDDVDLVLDMQRRDDPRTADRRPGFAETDIDL
jgi:uncharacterized protein YbjQ (UPF0145 family)